MYTLVATETGSVCHANWHQKPIPVSGTSLTVLETGTGQCARCKTVAIMRARSRQDLSAN